MSFTVSIHSPKSLEPFKCNIQNLTMECGFCSVSGRAPLLASKSSCSVGRSSWNEVRGSSLFLTDIT